MGLVLSHSRLTGFRGLVLVALRAGLVLTAVGINF
jgi:hypothetical protein